MKPILLSVKPQKKQWETRSPDNELMQFQLYPASMEQVKS